MLFDLKGRRRRVVQVTYVGLAVLMGGGLILSGIGSDASGGLLDALVGGDNSSGNGDAKKPFNNQIKAAEVKLKANPNDQAALATLVRAHFGLAGLEQETDDQGQTAITDAGVAEMKQADEAWRRYIATSPDPIDSSLALTAIQIYRVIGLPSDQKDKNELFVAPARAIAEKDNSVDAYITLVGVASQAGDTRTAGLAEKKALSLTTSKDEEATVKERIATAKAAAQQQSQQGAAGAGGNGAAPPTGGP